MKKFYISISPRTRDINKIRRHWQRSYTLLAYKCAINVSFTSINSLILKFIVKFHTWQIRVSNISFQRYAFIVKVDDTIKPLDAAARFNEEFIYIIFLRVHRFVCAFKRGSFIILNNTISICTTDSILSVQFITQCI